MSRIRHLVIFSSILFSGFSTLQADVQLAGLFTDHMVLQRQSRVPVWGTAADGEKVTVAIGDQTHTTTAQQGRWRIHLNPLKAGGPHKLTVSGTNTLTIQDVLVGEVWLCSGQSNMAMTVARAKDFDSEQKAAKHPQLRMYTVSKNATPKLQTDCKGTWQICQPDTVGTFSAAAYFFGRKLQQELNVPVGLINSSWGGTDVAAWTSLPAQQAVAAIVPKLEAYNKTIASYDATATAARNEKALERWKAAAAKARAAGEKIPRRPRLQADPAVNQNRPANLYNGMIHPLVGYAIRGAIWYQGERNSKNIPDGQLYASQLKTMITDWRKRWGIGDFQFITVQLPNFKARQNEPIQNTGWVAVRESELKSLRLPNTGIAITTDVGEANDIHPKNKQTVGLRLALWALGTTYGQEIVHSGPLFSSLQLKAARKTAKGTLRPGTLTLYYEHVGDALKTSDGKKLRGFAIAGEDRVFHHAFAVINEDGTVTVMNKAVEKPVAVRYNWSDNPDGNLVNSVDLPAAPFRTDGWKLE